MEGKGVEMTVCNMLANLSKWEEEKGEEKEEGCLCIAVRRVQSTYELRRYTAREPRSQRA